MDLPGHARALLTEARRSNERRILVLAGPRAAGITASEQVLGAIDVGISDTVILSDTNAWQAEHLEPSMSDRIMGRTCATVLMDCHASSEPNTMARATGAVDGGGLLVLLTPPLAQWPSTRDAFDESLVVAPFSIEDVGGRFKARLIEGLGRHAGISIVDLVTDTLVQSGETDPPDRGPPDQRGVIPADHTFPAAAYERCVTADQRRILTTFERLLAPTQAVIVSAPRGRGKSAVAGFAATSLATTGFGVVVTAARREHVRTLFTHARELAAELSVSMSVDADAQQLSVGDGTVTYRAPADAAAGDPDVVIADEAAGIPVPALITLLGVDRLGCCTTLFGYEGAGHGFSLRFRESLADARHVVTERRMTTPIRYAAEDPIEPWITDTLVLDARAPVADAIGTPTPASVTHRTIDPDELASDEYELREVIGLLQAAHYRTEPNDVARILDAPNLTLTTLAQGNHVVGVLLVAREGGLDTETRTAAYRGSRLHGNMIPDVFINEFRRPAMTARSGRRIVRIAVHETARRRGLGRALVDHLRRRTDSGWIGTGFGATPDVLAFWTALGFVPILLGATRNPASGSYSVVLLDANHPPTGGLAGQFGADFPDRLRASLPDVHRGVNPAVVAALFDAATDRRLALTIAEWRQVIAAAGGPGRYELDPRPVAALVMHDLLAAPHVLDEPHERLLIEKVLQGKSWETVAASWPSHGQARREFATAMSSLVDAYAGPTALRERKRLGLEES